MASFGQDWPVPETRDEAWECLDPILNRVMGYGVSAESLAKDLRRGWLGMDGFLAMLDHFVTSYGVAGELLQGKVTLLFEAISIACVSLHPLSDHILITCL